MKSSHFLKEGFVEDATDVHLDHEVQMARADCFHAAEDALMLHKLLRTIDERQGLEGWVAAKITLASDYLNTVREHLEYQLLNDQSGHQDLGMPMDSMPMDSMPIAEDQITEMSTGSVATVVNPTPKNKAKVGTLFGGTYTQKKKAK
jgi:hypothetical protein